MKKVKTYDLNVNMSSLTSLIGGSNFNEEIMVTVINQFNRDIFCNIHLDNNPFRINYVTFLLIINGEFEMEIDYKKYKFGKNTWIGISPMNIISSHHISNNLYCYLTMISQDFIENTIISNKTIPTSHMININLRENPGLSLSEKETITLKESIDRVLYYMKGEHYFKRDVIQNSLLNYLLEMGNIILGKVNFDSKEQLYSVSRKEVLTQQFLQLLRENGKSEHSPSYYSAKLCISTKYLSLLLKETTGKTAKDWIAQNTVIEAKILLKVPGTTIQTVSDELHFYDQASFTKFFKKNVGITPKKYISEY